MRSVDTSRCGGMADATDSKSVVREDMWVRVPPPVPPRTSRARECGGADRSTPPHPGSLLCEVDGDAGCAIRDRVEADLPGVRDPVDRPLDDEGRVVRDFAERMRMHDIAGVAQQRLVARGGRGGIPREHEGAVDAGRAADLLLGERLMLCPVLRYGEGEVRARRASPRWDRGRRRRVGTLLVCRVLVDCLAVDG